jgi:GYF domain 2
MSSEGYPAEYYDEEANWRISRGNSCSGPFRFADLVEAIDLQLLRATDFVWHHKWADWRQVKSVPSLEPFIEPPDHGGLASASAVVPMSDLVQHISIEPRENEQPTNRLVSSCRSKEAIYFANACLLGLAIGCLAVLSACVFGNSEHGILYLCLEFATLVAIIVWNTRTAITVSYRTLHICAILVVAAVLLVIMNVFRLPIGFDVWRAQQLLSRTHSSVEISRLAHDHPDNKFLEFVQVVDDAIQKSSAATLELKKEMEPRGITLTTMRASSTRDQLVEDVRAMRAAAASAETAMPRYLGILESERASLDEAGQKMYPDDPLFLVPNVMAALKKRHERLKERRGKTFAAIETFYSAKAQVAEFLVRNWDAAPTPRERSTFVDRATSEKYGRLAAAVRTAQTEVLELEREDAKLVEDRKSLWNIKVGRRQ